MTSNCKCLPKIAEISRLIYSLAFVALCGVSLSACSQTTTGASSNSKMDLSPSPGCVGFVRSDYEIVGTTQGGLGVWLLERSNKSAEFDFVIASNKGFHSLYCPIGLRATEGSSISFSSMDQVAPDTLSSQERSSFLELRSRCKSASKGQPEFFADSYLRDGVLVTGGGGCERIARQLSAKIVFRSQKTSTELYYFGGTVIAAN